MLSLRGLAAGFPGGFALPPLSVDVQPGTILRLAGGNGMGKSTLLRTIAGRQDALAGQVLFDDEPVAYTSAGWKRTAAVLLGDDAWITGLTAGEHLSLLARSHRVEDPQAAVAEVCAGLALPLSVLDSYPEALSSGQRRKVLLCGALARPAGLLLLDEPEQNLDASSVGALRELLAARAAAGTAVLLATHDDALIEPRVTRTVRIVEGPDGTIAYAEP